MIGFGIANTPLSHARPVIGRLAAYAADAVLARARSWQPREVPALRYRTIGGEGAGPVLGLGRARAAHDALKPRVAAQRIEQRIDPEPGNREPLGDGQQVFDLIEGGVVLAYHHENGHPIDAHLGPTERVSGEWQQFDRPLSFPEGVGSPAKARV